MKRSRFFTNVAVNITLVAILISVALIGVSGTENVEVFAPDAVYRGNVLEKNVSLMFNVYWGTEYIEELLNVLKTHGIKTTFFIGGSWASKNVEALKSIASAGHEIGNHGYLHKDAEKLTYEQNVAEITLTNKLLKEILDVETFLFAPPSGSVGNAMFQACKDLNQTVIMWSRDTIDWRDKDCDLVYKRASSGIQNGDLILMHPTEHTLKALPKIILNLKSQGYTLVTVSKCISPTQV